MSANGFTVLELLAVMSILGILLMLVTPSIKSMIDKQQVRGACESIYQNMALARSSAVSLNKKVTFSFRSSNAGATWCVGLSDGAACNCYTSAASCRVNGIQRTANSADFGKVDSEGKSSIKVTGIGSDTSVAFDPRDASPDILPDTALVRSNTWACAISIRVLGQVKYLTEGSGTTRRAIVPLAEAGALN